MYSHSKKSGKFDTFYILDLDRTLVRTDDLRKAYEQTLLKIAPELTKDITTARIRYKSNFDLIAYIYAVLLKKRSSSEVEKLLTHVNTVFINHARKQSFLEPFAAELLKYLEKNKIPMGILTTGGDAWQNLKIEAAGLSRIPHLIIHGFEKGKLINTWRQHNGDYVLPEEFDNIHVKSLVFLDDKTVSFIGIPVDVVGLRIISVTAQEPLEKDTPLPPNVSQVKGLKEAMKLLFFVV